MTERISSAQNPFVQGLKRLNDKKHRDAEGLLLAEGPKLVDEALREGLAPARALVDEMRADALSETIARLEGGGCAVRLGPASLLRAVSETRAPQGVCASFSLPRPLADPAEVRRLAALDGVQDPGNAGGIWRTADAAGFDAMLMSADCADPFSPKVVRSAMGSAFRVPLRREGDLPGALLRLRREGFRVIVTALDGEDFFAAMPGPDEKVVLVIGSEGHGVRPETRAAATDVLRLPMRGGAESLNANVAAGIMLYSLAFALRGQG